MDDIRNACPISWKLRTTILAIVHRFHWSAFSLSSFSFSNHVSVNDRILFIHSNLFFLLLWYSHSREYSHWLSVLDVFNCICSFFSFFSLTYAVSHYTYIYSLLSLSRARWCVCVWRWFTKKNQILFKFLSSFLCLKVNSWHLWLSVGKHVTDCII